MEKFPITVDGFKKMEEELKNLKAVQRPNVIAAIATARELGDLSENAEYAAARERQSFIEGRIVELEDKIVRAEIIDISKLSGKKIKFGATVQLVNEETEEESRLQIVGEYEADIALSKISINSPLGRALIGKEQGDIVEVRTPSGFKNYEIISFVYES
jgi:transcription elongation factor GreA